MSLLFSIFRMLAKIVISAISLFFLTLLQSSFLPHFVIFGYAPNFILVLVIFVFFLMPSVDLPVAFFGGLFLDIFSSHFLGFYTSILLATLLFIRLIARKYVQF